MPEFEEIRIPEEKLIVPVDGAIGDFRKHLLSHPRTILSAKYGDGKSYFLQQFEQDEKVQEQFVFLKLFPVNYQVVSNEDIFELIKYDLIFQLYNQGMLDYIEEMSNSKLMYWFYAFHEKDIVQFLCEAGAAIGILPDNLSAVIEKLDDLLTKWENFKEGNGREELAHFTQNASNHYLYEADPVTSFIKEAINKFKEANPKKKIVLAIEDMDRLDPAHLFRILNVLSAQVDYTYRYGVSPDRNTVEGNKFGVDNVLLVMDYANTRHIYSHFYGGQTNFDGYINKFISHGIFEYSLAKEKCNYFAEYLFKTTHVKDSLIRELLPDTFYEGKTIREIQSAVGGTKTQLFDLPIYVDLNTSTDLHMGILQLLVVMRRLGKTDAEIEEHVERQIIQRPRDMMYYLGGYWLTYKGQLASVLVRIKYPSREGHSLVMGIYGVNEDGFALLCNEKDMYSEVCEADDMREFVRYLLDCVAKEH